MGRPAKVKTFEEILDATRQRILEFGLAPDSLPEYLVRAFGELNVAEVPGPKANNRIVSYHSHTSLKSTSDETAWCSAFVCAMLAEAGLPHTGSAAARSFINYGKRVENPTPGCIAVLRRTTNPASGHVAFFLKQVGDKVFLLGGNQGNRVSISQFPISQLICYVTPNQ